MRIDWRDPNVGWLLVLGVPLALLIAFAGACRIAWTVNSQPLRFDARLWAEDHQGNREPFGPHSTRQRMLEDLLSAHLRAGMARSELVPQLGPPTTARGQDVLIWRLGELPSQDIQCLDVRLDPSGERVTDWSVEARWIP